MAQPISPASIHPARRVLTAVAGLGLSLYWARELWRSEGGSTFPWTETALFAVAVIALLGLQSGRLGAQIAGRAAALGYLVMGAIGAIATRSPEAAFVAACAGGSLLAVGRGPLRSPSALAQFSPIGYRRTFLVASVLQVVGAYALAFIGLAWLAGPMRAEDGAFGLTPVLMLGFSAALLASVFGVLRMRAWGVLAALASAVGATTLAVLSAFETTRLALGLVFFDDMGLISWLWAAAAVLPLGMAVPVVLSRVWPVRLASKPLATGAPTAAS
jgi:hypothetical protein